jgi:Putative O-antigen polymerase
MGLGARAELPVTLAIGACAAAGAGLLAIAVSGIPPWQLALLALVLAASLVAVRHGAAHPLAIVPVVLGVYFLLGVQDWVALSGYSSFRSEPDTESVLRLAVYGLLAYAGGACAAGAGPWRAGYRLRAGSLGPRRVCLVAAGVLAAGGLVGTAATVAHAGVIVFDMNARQVVPGLEATLAYELIPAGVIAALAVERRSTRLLAIGGAAGLLYVFVGYRNVVVLLIAVFFMFRALQGRVRMLTAVAVIVGLGSLALLTNYVRETQTGEIGVYGREVKAAGPLTSAPVLTPLYFSIAHEGVAVLARMQREVPASYRYMHGGLMLSSLTVMLPGKQDDPRNIVTKDIYRTQPVSTTVTPTLLGEPYVDFGAVGVVGYMGLLGALLGALYRRAMRSASASWALAYAYCAALTVVSVHIGMVDVQYYLFIPAGAAIAFWIGRRVQGLRGHPAIGLVPEARSIRRSHRGVA